MKGTKKGIYSTNLYADRNLHNSIWNMMLFCFVRLSVKEKNRIFKNFQLVLNRLWGRKTFLCCWLAVLFPLPFPLPYWSIDSQRNGIGKQSGCENSWFRYEIYAVTKGTLNAFIWVYTKMSISNAEESLLESDHAKALNSEFKPPKLWDINIRAVFKAT